MAGQTYHDALAEDDKTYTTPTFAPGVAAVMMQVTGGLVGAQAAAIARQAAHKIEKSLAVDRLMTRSTHLFDIPIVEEEIAAEYVDPAFFRLATSGRPFIEGDRLAPAQVEALDEAIRIGEIPSEVESLLRENGLDRPKDHSDRRALALALTRSRVKALDAIAKREKGAPIETPIRPPLVRAAETQAETVPTLSAMRVRWIERKRPSRKQIDDNARYLRLFTDLHGDLPVDQIASRHVRAFRDKLLLCPRNVPSSFAKAPIEDLEAFALKNPDRPKLGRGTINKALGAISALLRVAVQDEHIQRNPVDGQKLEIKATDTLERQPHTIDELNAIFRTTVYGTPPDVPDAGSGWAAWWLPVLALFVGARLEELGQLLIADVGVENRIPFIEVTDMPDDGDRVKAKSVKTDAGRRRVPLHSVLIRLGFLDYVAHQKARGFTTLFPALRRYRGRATKNWSRWWGRWIDKHVTRDKRKCFHSLRHSLIRELRRQKTSSEIIKAIVGHSAKDVTSGYGRSNGQLYDLTTLDSELQRLRYEGLDLTALEGEQPWRAVRSSFD